MKSKKIIILVIAVILLAAGFLAYRLIFGRAASVGINASITDESDKTAQVDTGDQRILVVYFSETGNTQELAKLISDQVGGDFKRIETVTPYPEGTALYDYVKAERDNDERPELKDMGIDLSNYDTIFVGYPMWWYTLPMPMYTFFDTYDFAGKTIIPFNTHEGSGDGGTYDTIRSWEPEATVLDGLPIRGGDMSKDQMGTVVNWLNGLGFSAK